MALAAGVCSRSRKAIIILHGGGAGWFGREPLYTQVLADELDPLCALAEVATARFQVAQPSMRPSVPGGGPET